MKANYGKFFNTSGKAIDTITLEKTLPFPKKIGILINKNTVSSGELFTIIARQSDKVIVFGENSGGMMDYGKYSTI
jgi:C-terminal processing protease CtpA/Prc